MKRWVRDLISWWKSTINCKLKSNVWRQSPYFFFLVCLMFFCTYHANVFPSMIHSLCDRMQFHLVMLNLFVPLHLYFKCFCFTLVAKLMLLTLCYTKLQNKINTLSRCNFYFFYKKKLSFYFYGFCCFQIGYNLVSTCKRFLFHYNFFLFDVN